MYKLKFTKITINILKAEQFQFNLHKFNTISELLLSQFVLLGIS